MIPIICKMEEFDHHQPSPKEGGFKNKVVKCRCLSRRLKKGSNNQKIEEEALQTSIQPSIIGGVTHTRVEVTISQFGFS